MPIWWGFSRAFFLLTLACGNNDSFIHQTTNTCCCWRMGNAFCFDIATADDDDDACVIQNDNPGFDQTKEHVAGLKIHSMISAELDANHEAALTIPLREATDEQLLAEVARRNLDIHGNITLDMVKASYVFDQKPLGHGASGEVYKVTQKSTGEVFACKIIKKDGNMNDAASMATEIEIMKRVRHRHVVSLIELYESPKCLWVVLELVNGGDLRGLVANHTHLSEGVVAHHMKQILDGVHYLHSRGVVHRDIKLDNILMTKSGDVKIADFGLSALIQVGTHGYDLHDSSKRKKYDKLTDLWGTPMFYAPELIDGKYGPQVDMWSTGCVLYELLTGHEAFQAKNVAKYQTELYSKIRHANYNKEILAELGISSLAQDLLQGLLTPDPASRLSATEALRHPWITGTGHNQQHSAPLKGTRAPLAASANTTSPQGRTPLVKKGSVGSFLKEVPKEVVRVGSPPLQQHLG